MRSRRPLGIQKVHKVRNSKTVGLSFTGVIIIVINVVVFVPALWNCDLQFTSNGTLHENGLVNQSSLLPVFSRIIDIPKTKKISPV